MPVQLPSPSSPSAMSRQTAEHVRLKIRSNEIDNEFAGWERPFAEQEGETGQIALLCSVSVHRKSSLRNDNSRLCLALLTPFARCRSSGIYRSESQRNLIDSFALTTRLCEPGRAAKTRTSPSDAPRQFANRLRFVCVPIRLTSPQIFFF